MVDNWHKYDDQRPIFLSCASQLSASTLCLVAVEREEKLLEKDVVLGGLAEKDTGLTLIGWHRISGRQSGESREQGDVRRSPLAS